ncbi:MAG: ChaN family lipoprotein [Desulfobacterales bacterium]|nr:ChaN family lipoprotein [Desulfobacterales bacterium]
MISKIVPALLLFSLTATTACGSDDSFRLWDVSEQTEISLSEAAGEFPGGGIVVVGEQHGVKAHHEGQVAVIKAAREAGLDVAVGLEMFQRIDQPDLDRFVAGEIGMTELSNVFARSWSNFEAYQPIFEYCRQKKIPMLGLNVPRRITRKVARSGFESLTADDIGLLPPIACEVGPAYESFLRRVLGDNDHGSGTFEQFCEAQLVWDAAMAVHALAYMKDHPDSNVIILCGIIHAWKPAIPAQVKKQSPGTPHVVIQPLINGRFDRSTASPDDTDYLLLDSGK